MAPNLDFPLRTLDIFSGTGLGSHGAQAAGAEIVGGVDMSSVATSSFKANFPNASVLTAKLEDLDMTEVKRRFGEIDLLLSSPECTNHTCAKGSAPRSEASRDTAMQSVRFASTFLPRWIVLENVVSMKPWSRYGELKTALTTLGYNLSENVLDSSDFGVPQARRRLFLVGDRKAKPPVSIPVRSGPRRTAESILDPNGTWRAQPLFGNGRARATITRAQRARKILGKQTNFLLVYYGTDGSGGWQPLTRPLRTITTVDRFALVEAGDNDPTMRMLQVPELKRAMGLGEEFLLSFGTRRDQIRLLGNGVCPPVMEAVIGALVRTS